MKKILYTMILACSTMMVSCDSWLEVKPYDKISEGELQKSEEGYQKMLNGIYIDLNSDALYGQSLSVEMIEVMGGAYAIGTDNSVWGNYKDLSNYQYGTEYWRNRLDQTWNKAYALILNCNKILENIDQNQDLFTGGNYYAVKGEALALRAMLHFDMLRLFGPVYAKDSDKKAIPYYNKQTNSPEPILTAKEVAEKVVADLEEARILLANDPVKTEGTLMSGSQDGTSNFMRYRALRLNYYAVEALLARVNLYMGNKTEAFKYATDVIKTADQGIFPFVDKSLVIGSPADPDRIFSSEVLFALTNTSRSKIHKNFYDPSRLPNYVFRMDDNLMSNIVYGGAATTGGYQDDYRYRANWIATGSNRYFYKYSDMVANGSIQNTMIPMIRLGEMFLIA
ncbi:MAG TPA: RagB/SusD family nutrient uptake outer membrane protein, partial [Segatella copri]|nr:RagB/SusD family nutrient uptake outer membrane protein [Segatella copri]